MKSFARFLIAAFATVGISAGGAVYAVPPSTPAPLTSPAISAAGGQIAYRPLNLRAPSKTDDTNKGYVVGDMWNFNSRIFYAEAIAAGTAAWSEVYQDPATLPVDAVGAATLAYSCSHRLTVTYTGALCQIIRASDSTTKDIPYLSNNDADAAIVWNFCSGTTCKLTIEYDQSGNANNATQTTDANRPPVGARKLGGKFAITYTNWGGITDASTTANVYLNIPSMTFNRAANSVVMTLAFPAPGRLNNSAAGQAIYQLGNSGTSVEALFTSVAPAATNWRINPGGSAIDSTLNVESEPSVLIHVWGATQSISQNNNSVTGLTGATSSFTAPGYIASSNTANFQAAVTIGDFIEYARALTTAEQKTLKALEYAQYGIVPQYDTRVVFEGDSGVAGTGAAFNDNISDQFMRQLGDQMSVVNLGTSGFTGATIQAAYAARLGATFKTGKRNIAVILDGANDINNNGSTGAATYTIIASQVASAHATGYLVCVSTPKPSSTYYGADSSDSKWIARDALIVLERANTAGADCIVDYAADPFTGTQPTSAADTTLYYDNIHGTRRTLGIQAGIVVRAVKPLIPAQ